MPSFLGGDTTRGTSGMPGPTGPTGPTGRDARGRAAGGPRQDLRERRHRRQRRNTLRTVLVGIACLVLGVTLGLLLYPVLPIPGSPGVVVGQTTVPEGGLDSPMGTYTYKGHTVTVTVREAIEDSSSLEAAQNSDGTYEVPSADAVLSVARNRILLDDAAQQGIEATDEDALAYAQDTLGTDDLTVIAANYNMDTDQVMRLMRDSATLRKLRDQVVSSAGAAAPAEPEPAEAGQEDTPSEKYAAYVTGLAGDEWDAEANTWASDDGPFREALRDYTVSNTEATYSAAQAAYYVAYTQYTAAQQATSSEWTAYVNEKLAGVTVELGTLVA